MKAFNFAGLKQFVLEKQKENISDLVKNSMQTSPIQMGSSKIKKHPIALSLKEFANICNLSYLEQEYDQN